MQHFYDGQIRRYIAQIVRFFSNFTVRYSDGTLHRVPVMYGDEDRQVASIIRGNSENKVNSAPRIAVYVTSLDLDASRLGDSTFVGKVHIRERGTAIDEMTGDPYYINQQGANYTVERIMPTPFKLTVKVDLWTTSTDQKLQLLEQILVLFNPSIELQTTDNYIDWTSLSTLTLDQTTFSSRTVPVGADSPIDIASLAFSTPIWISPPAKVKQLGVITNIIMNVFDGIGASPGSYIEGLGVDPSLDNNRTAGGTQLTRVTVGISDYGVMVYGKQWADKNQTQHTSFARLLAANEAVLPPRNSFDISDKTGPGINWSTLFDQYPGQYRPDFSIIRLMQPNGAEVIGTIVINPLDETQLSVNWDQDTFPSDTLIDSEGRWLYDQGFDQASARGNFDAIIDPQKIYPGHGMQNVEAGDRFLIVEDIGHEYGGKLYDSTVTYKFDDIVIYLNKHYKSISLPPVTNILPTSDNTKWQLIDGPDAWKSTNGIDFVAYANDIIEWDGSQWNIVFNSSQETERMAWQTNIYTGVQYTWNTVSWVKSFEGEYRTGEWSLEL
jgi:hypothetical protein